MNLSFIPRVLWAGFRAFWKERLYVFLWRMWRDDPEVARAVAKWLTGTPGQPARTFHLMKNIGQELFQAINAYDDAAEGGEDGKRAFKIAAGLTITAGGLGLVAGAGMVVMAWVLS